MYNGARFITAALESIKAQTRAVDEVIVVDDGSTDGSAGLAAAAGAQVVVQRNGGPASARNAGIRASSGDMIAILDSDDLWTPVKMERQLAPLLEGGAVDLTFGHVVQFRGAVPATLDGLPSEPALLAGGMLVTRRAFDKVGWFNESRRLGDFIDWYARAVECGLRVRVIPDVVLLRRLHDQNMGIREAGNRADYARLARAALQRRRKAGDR